MRAILTFPWVLVVLSAVVPAQTFGGPFPQVVIPDGGPGVCLGMVSPISRVVTVPAGLPAIPSIRVTLGISHSFIGDVRFTISHAGLLVTLLGPPAPCPGDGSDLLGLYTFDDAAATPIAVAALIYADTAVIPPGSYIGSGLLAPFVGTPPAGPWTFTVWDTAGGTTGAIYDARVSFGMPTNYVVTSPGPGAVSIAHTFGAAGNAYLAAYELGTAGVPYGWFFGVDVNFPNLLTEIAAGPPFYGTLNAVGAAFFFLPPGSLPSGLMASTVAVHFDMATGTLIWVSPPSTFTIM